MAPKKENANARTVSVNRRARRDYFIDDIVEAGLILKGTEVKALREGRATIAEAYAASEKGGIWLINATIPEYSAGNRENHEPKRPRQLLLNKREIARLAQAVDRKGFTLIPMKLFFNERGIAKLELGIGQGKKLHDKRSTAKDRDWSRQKQRLMRDKG